MRPPCLNLEDVVRAKIGFVLLCCIPAFIHPGSERVIHAQESSKGKGSGRTSAGQARFRTAVLPVLAKYCTGCHGPSKPKAGLNLASFRDEASARSNRKAWERIKEYVEGGLMPPDDRPQPSREELAQLTDWIKSALKADDCGRTFDPGRVTIRRLNRAEYNNTIRDLIGIDFHPADDFPSDDVGYGFDNIGDVLSMPPILLEKYLAAAEAISEEAIIAASSAKGMVKTWNSETLGSGAGGSPQGDGTLVLTSESEIVVNYPFPRTAHYIVRVRACGDQAGPDPVRMAIRIDGKELKRFDVTAPSGKFQDFQFRQNLRGGPRRLSVAFLNDYYQPSAPDPKQRDRNLIVESIEVEGPLYSTGDPLPESHRRIVFTTPKNAIDTSRASRSILERFASRAYRRPVSDGEIAKLMKLVELALQKGDSFERGIQLALQAMLVSPQFLFRAELGSYADSTNRKVGETTRVEMIGNFELASRLSYFLWSSMPDDELWRAALDGSLRSADVLEKQVRRMLRDPKAHALVENFAGQWLQLRNLRSFNPDRGRFPSFDDKLRDAMIRETELFFGAVMRGDSSILDFIDSDFTYVNEQLARHYGIPGVKGEQFRRVKLKGHERGGLVTQASILTVTSNPTRTSPVKRGKWVLEQLLGTPPPPPPPNVPVLTDDAKALTAATLRLRMEQHRSKASCAVCHNKLDPLGFGLENFDAIGAWRNDDSGGPVDSSGTLPSGESFRGPKELKVILKAHSPEFSRCLTEKMLTYALGRGLEEYDRCAVEQIVKSLEPGRYRFSVLVLGIVKSDPFQKRRG
jgi:mono/diheme cytochrome c family protein